MSKRIFLYFSILFIILFLTNSSSSVYASDCTDELDKITTETQTKLDIIISETLSTESVEISRYCPGGSLNDQYYENCYQNFSDSVVLTRLTNLNCTDLEKQIFDNFLKPKFIYALKKNDNDVGAADMTKVLTPRPEITPIYDDNINQLIKDVSEGCGGEDLQCCTPDVVKIPDIDVGLPIFDRLLNMAKEKLLGWMIGPQIDTITTVYKGTDARICVADFEPQIVDGDGNELMVKNQYNIIDGSDPSEIKGEYIIESYVNSQGTPIPTPEVTRIPNTPDKVGSCTCINPDVETPSDDVLGDSTPIICDRIGLSGEEKEDCYDCENAGKSWKKETSTCEPKAVNTRNMQFLCKNATGDENVEDSEKYKCIDCAKKAQIWTALGCINMNLDQIIQEQIFGLGIGLAGVSALLCIIYSAFILQLSANNPEKIKHAQEMMTSCITGLIIIIFSVFILNVIGVDILRIPGFARPTPTPTPVSTGS